MDTARARTHGARTHARSVRMHAELASISPVDYIMGAYQSMLRAQNVRVWQLAPVAVGELLSRIETIYTCVFLDILEFHGM